MSLRGLIGLSLRVESVVVYVNMAILEEHRKQVTIVERMMPNISIAMSLAVDN